MATIGNTITHGITLAGTGAYASPLTIAGSGYIDNPGTSPSVENAVYGPGSGPWTLVNYGRVVASGLHGRNGVRLAGGGLVVNSGTISGPDYGVAIYGAAGTVVNAGYIGFYKNPAHGWEGVDLEAGGLVVNQAGATLTGLGSGVHVDGALGTVVNAGYIGHGIGPGHSGAAVELHAGGVVDNQAGGTLSGFWGARFFDMPGTVVNSGTIDGTAEGIRLGDGGSIVNERGGTITEGGTIAGGIGMFVVYASAYVTNAGNILEPFTLYSGPFTIYGNSVGIVFTDGGTLVNQTDGTIIAGIGVVTGPSFADLSLSPATVTNVGTIGAGNYGVYFLGGGVVTNQTQGVITATAHAGIRMNSVGTVINAGTMTAGSLGVDLVAGGTVSNAGTIIGAGGTAVSFGAGDSLLLLYPQAVLGGQVVAVGAANVLELAAGGAPGSLPGIDTSFADFGTVRIDPGAAWNLSGNAAAMTLVNDGTIAAATGAALALGMVTEDPGRTGLAVISGSAGVELTASADAQQSIAFSGTGGRLQIDGVTMPGGTIFGFAPGNGIDLPDVLFSLAATVNLLPGNVLQVSESGANFDLQLDPNYDFGNQRFALVPDGSNDATLIETVLVPGRPNDFNADGMSDILWLDREGAVSAWLMAGTTVLYNTQPGGLVEQIWAIDGTGDFYGTGTADVLWRGADGTVAIQAVEGTAVTATGLADSSAWTIVATGDLDGNGTSDILWRDTSGDVAVWEMSGTTVLSNNVIGFADPTHWRIRGVGDFDGNRTADILWQDSAGDVAIWNVNGTGVTSSGFAGFADPTTWHISGVGEFNGDGRSDILWQDNRGDVAIWEMNGTTAISNRVVGFADPSTWHIAGVGDYNGDGMSDILWRDTSGYIDIWFMNGNTVAATAFAGFADPNTWSIVPPDNTGDISAGGFGFGDIAPTDPATKNAAEPNAVVAPASATGLPLPFIPAAGVAASYPGPAFSVRAG